MTLNRALSKQEIQGTLPRIQEFLIQRRHCIAWHTEHAAAQEASSLPLICCGLQGTCIVASGCLPISQPGATSPCHLVQSYKPEMLHGAFTLASRLHAVSFAKGCGAHARTWGVETNSSYRLLYSACISWVRSACVSGQTAGMEATPRRVLDCPGPGPFLTLDNTAAVQRTALANACGQIGYSIIRGSGPLTAAFTTAFAVAFAFALSESKRPRRFDPCAGLRKPTPVAT